MNMDGHGERVLGKRESTRPFHEKFFISAERKRSIEICHWIHQACPRRNPQPYFQLQCHNVSINHFFKKTGRVYITIRREHWKRIITTNRCLLRISPPERTFSFTGIWPVFTWLIGHMFLYSKYGSTSLKRQAVVRYEFIDRSRVTQSYSNLDKARYERIALRCWF